MNQKRWLIIGILTCLLVSGIGYFWANGLMDSLFAYRSPLHSKPPAPGTPLGKPITHRVVIVLIDALRYDASLNTNVMPFLNTMRTYSASSRMHSQPPSYSEPGYTTILTGAWPDINDGPAINIDYANIPTFTQDDIFSAAHRMGLRTAISGYYWFEKLVPQAAVDTSFYTPGEDASADQEVMKAALPMLSGNYQLVLIHLDQVDYAGHYLGGPLDPRSHTAEKKVDDYLRQIVSAMDLNLDTLIILSDHGQIDRGGHGGSDTITLLEPFVMVGAGVHAGPLFPDMAQVDVAPTVAVLLGTNIPASAQGQVLKSMLDLPSDEASSIQSAEILQKRILFQSYTDAINDKPTHQFQSTDPFSYVLAIDNARADRLARERVWRNFLAIVFAVLPAYFLVINAKKKILWLAGGSLIYLLVFNVRYAILDGFTYSLSSVKSQEWLLTYIAVTSGVALLFGWLVSMLRLKAFQASSGDAAKTSLGLVLFTIYILALPILVSFAMNGVLVTWTLPNFVTSYIALISLIQWIIVAALGLLLTGVAALVAQLVPSSASSYRKSRR